jgi:cell division protein FtsZ
MATVRAFASPEATIAQGIAYDDAMGEDIRVTVVATGLGRAKKSMQLVQTPVLRTGTNNESVMAMAGMAPMGAAVGASSQQMTAPGASFEAARTPAVWRRESASDTVRALEKNGMETYDIPAFLRKQAD